MTKNADANRYITYSAILFVLGLILDVIGAISVGFVFGVTDTGTAVPHQMTTLAFSFLTIGILIIGIAIGLFITAQHKKRSSN